MTMLVVVVIALFIGAGLTGTLLRLRSQRRQAALREKMAKKRSELKRRTDELEEQARQLQKPE